MEKLRKKQDEAFKNDDENFQSLDGMNNSGERCKKFKNLFKWYGLLKNIDDEDLKIICGTDCALFLVFERYASYFFSTVTIINLFLFIPIYLTGNRDDPSMYIPGT